MKETQMNEDNQHELQEDVVSELDDLIEESNQTEEPETDDADLEDSDKVEGDLDGVENEEEGEEESEIDEGAVEDVEAVPREDVATDISKPAEARFEEIAKQFEVVDPRAQIQQKEQELLRVQAALTNEAITAALPKDVTPDNKLIALLDESELDDYMTLLHDEGRVSAAHKVRNTWEKAQEKIQEAARYRQQIAHQRVELANQKLEITAAETRKKFLDKVPELEPHMPAIASTIQAYIDERPEMLHVYAENPAELERAVVHLIKTNNLLAKGTKEEMKKQTKKPSAPDSQAGGKRVKTSSKDSVAFTQQQINAMSVQEYEKNKTAIFAQMAKGLIK
jgi:hypothetical protein